MGKGARVQATDQGQESGVRVQESVAKGQWSRVMIKSHWSEVKGHLSVVKDQESLFMGHWSELRVRGQGHWSVVKGQ